MKKIKNNIDTTISEFKSATRDVFIQNGYNDMRFVSKAIPDKKKLENRNECRRWKRDF